MNDIRITVAGPAGVGKSVICKVIADALVKLGVKHEVHYLGLDEPVSPAQAKRRETAFRLRKRSVNVVEVETEKAAG